MLIAIVLGAGGTQGAFEASAVRWLFDHGVRPEILSGCSVGSLNATKLAEGELPGEPSSVDKLESEWTRLAQGSDMWVEREGFSRFKTDSKDLMKAFAEYYSIPWGFAGMKLVAGFVSLLDCKKFAEDLKQVTDSPSLYTRDPLHARLSQSLNLSAIGNSAIKLRIPIVSLDTGNLRWVDNAGNVLDSNGDKVPGVRNVSLVEAVMASSAQPIAFPPVVLNGEAFTDGGVRQYVPIDAALALGADRVFAVSTKEAGVTSAPVGTFSGPGLMEIAGRVATIMANEIQEREFKAIGLGEGQLTRIGPSIELPDSLLVDPGIIDVLMAYGFMRSFDCLAGQTSDYDTSDEIVKTLLNIWDQENWAGQARDMPDGMVRMPRAQDMVQLRILKRSLAELVANRLQSGAEVPASAVNWMKWGRHPWSPIPDDLWDSYTFLDGSTVGKETPPAITIPPFLQGHLHMTVSIDENTWNMIALVDTPFTVRSIDRVKNAPVSALFSIDGNVALSGDTNKTYHFSMHAGAHKLVVRSPPYLDIQKEFRIVRRQQSHPTATFSTGKFVKAGSPTQVTVSATDPQGIDIPEGTVTITVPRQTGLSYNYQFKLHETKTITFNIQRTRSRVHEGDADEDGTVVTYPTGKVTGMQDFEDAPFELLGPPPVVMVNKLQPGMKSSLQVTATDEKGDPISLGTVTITNYPLSPIPPLIVGSTSTDSSSLGLDRQQVMETLDFPLVNGVAVSSDFTPMALTDDDGNIIAYPRGRLKTDSYKDATFSIIDES